MVRKRKYSTGEANLYLDPTNGGNRYKNPVNGNWTRLGLDLARARVAARILNEKLLCSPNYVAKVAGITTLSDFLEVFKKEILPDMNLAKSTLRDYSNKLVHIEHQIGAIDIATVGVRPIASFLDDYPDRQSNLYRSVLIQIFKHAIAKGLRPLELSNPVQATIPKSAEVKRQRLTLESYQLIYAESCTTLQRAMSLALVSLQRREDLTRLRQQHVVNGALQFQQHKTGVPLRISLDIGLHGMTLREIVASCKDMIGIQHLLHYPRDAARPHVGKPLSPDWLTKAFSEVRDRLKICSELPARQRPSFHEIRALGAKLYEQAGYPQKWINLLLGHQTAEMTTRYLSRHEVQWIEVNVV